MSNCCETSPARPLHVAVIGGGSAGFAAAIEAQASGARVTLVNAGTIGGTCVNVGCVPSKTLIRAAAAHHRGARHDFRGIEGRSRLSNFADVIAHKDELVRSLRHSKYIEVLAQYAAVTLLPGRAMINSPREIAVDGRYLAVDRIVVATGASSWAPPVPGLDSAGALDSTSALELTELPESLIVLGGRYIALELAQMFGRFGTRVTVLQRSGHILPDEDDDLTEALAGHLRAEGVDVQVGVSLEQVTRRDGVVVVGTRVRGEVQTFRAAQLLVATGRRANTAGLGLEDAGVALRDDGAVVVDAQLRTSVPGIYAAGDVTGEQMYVYTAAYEGKLAAHNAVGAAAARERDYTALPWVVFTDPQLSGVGLNEKQAARAGIDVDVATLPLSFVPRALAARDVRGTIKLLRRRGSDSLVGARFVAPEAGELVMEAALALRHGIAVSELAAAFHPYLTHSEGIKLCAQAFDVDISALSCCVA